MPGEKPAPASVSFGAFKVDFRSQELWKNGMRLRVRGQSFEVLKMLLERPGELVTREEIRQVLWPSDTFVDFEHSLNVPVNRLREALADSAENPKFIETLPRRGYRFIAAIHPESARPLSSRGKLLLFVSVAAVLALSSAGALLWRWRLQKTAPQSEMPSVAVLPFADLSPNHDQEYFSDGLAEEILNDLTAIPNLKVVARTSAFQFKGKNEDLRSIGRRLNTENILEGSVRKEGVRVRITAQLVSAKDGFHLWAQSYDRDINDVFSVQDEIARAVTSALQLRLIQGKSPVASASRTTNAGTYQAYLQARYFASKNNTESMVKALQYINAAIDADPLYAPAYAWRSYIRQTQYFNVGGSDDPQLVEKARRDAEKAIELDPNLGDGYRVLSWEQAWYEFNCPEAERTLSKAMELAPGDAWNLEAKGLYATCMGNPEQAVELIRQSIARDPLLVLPRIHLALNLRDLGHYQDASATIDQALDLDPHAYWLHEIRCEALLAQGQAAQALTEIEKEPPGALHDVGLALAYHALGRDRDSDAVLAHMVKDEEAFAAYQIAEVYAYRGDPDRAFAWLNRAYERHDGGLGMFKTDLLLKSLRGDPRYVELLRRMNLIQ